MNEYIASKLSGYCYMVNTGCKPVAMTPIQDSYYEQIIKRIKNQQLNFYA